MPRHSIPAIRGTCAGYGRSPPHPQWPGGARIAVQFVLNYEEGGENCVLHGDAASETFLSEIVGAQPFAARHMSMESLYEYGSRAGVWRLLRLFRERAMPLTVFGVGMALARNPAVVDAFLEDGHEIASHGWRWISYQNVDEAIEREHMARAVETITRLTGRGAGGLVHRPRQPEHAAAGRRARRLPVFGRWLRRRPPYCMPVTTRGGVEPLLIVPYALDTNDMRFATPQGFNSGDQFYACLKDAFDVLYAEGDPKGLNAPKMLSVGLHCRLGGRPARAAALARFLDYVRDHDAVWIARRADIARHWRKLIRRPREHLTLKGPQRAARSTEPHGPQRVHRGAGRNLRALAVGGGAHLRRPAVRQRRRAARGDGRGDGTRALRASS